MRLVNKEGARAPRGKKEREVEAGDGKSSQTAHGPATTRRSEKILNFLIPEYRKTTATTETN